LVSSKCFVVILLFKILACTFLFLNIFIAKSITSYYLYALFQFFAFFLNKKTTRLINVPCGPMMQ